MVDSAITMYEQFLETPQLNRLSLDAAYLAHILQRLGAQYLSRRRSSCSPRDGY